MKLHAHKIILLIGIFFYVSIGYGQNPVIDSLHKVLQTQKDDTNKVNTLNELSYSYLRETNFTNVIQFGNLALALAEKIRFKRDEANSYINIAKGYASHDIVKAHGGELIVETKGGEGSEFIIQLPI